MTVSAFVFIFMWLSLSFGSARRSDPIDCIEIFISFSSPAPALLRVRFYSVMRLCEQSCAVALLLQVFVDLSY
uniref:Putative secreted protein n=1 Tax=Anopheles darlingi TaxID=43151 RepID=A0A2M4DFL1_ANODA